MALQGVADRSAVPDAELDAYVDLLKREYGGHAFLQIMRGFERTPAKRDLYRSVLSSTRYPVQVVWGAQDPALKLDLHGEAVRRARWRRHDPPPPRKALPAGGPGPRHRRAGHRDHARLSREPLRRNRRARRGRG